MSVGDLAKELMKIRIDNGLQRVLGEEYNAPVRNFLPSAFGEAFWDDLMIFASVSTVENAKKFIEYERNWHNEQSRGANLQRRKITAKASAFICLCIDKMHCIT